ncbi:MAG: hydrogenase maturation nickel metallochaperone HypA [Candidatus Bathyarchaeia archaeon]
MSKIWGRNRAVHEFSTMQSILGTILKVAEEHGAERVVEVNLEIGELTFLNPEQLRFSFEVLSEKTIAEGAVLNIERIRTKIRCLDCGYEGPSKYDGPEYHTLDIPVFLRCGRCGGISVKITAGRECNVKDIKVKLQEGRKR